MNAYDADRPMAGFAAKALAPSLERRRLRYYIGLVLVDVSLIIAAFLLAGRSYLDFRPDRVALLEAQLLIPLYLTIALSQRAYSLAALERWRFAAGRAVGALAWSAMLLIFITFYTKSTASFSRVVFTAGVAGSAALMVVSRYAVHRWIAHHWGASVTNTLIIDADGPQVSLPNAIRVSAELDRISPDPGDPIALDRLGRYLLNMDRVIVSCPVATRLAWVQAMRAAGVRGEVVTESLGDLEPIGVAVEDGWRSLIVSTGPLGLRQRVLKRGFDTAFSLLALTALSPLLLLVAIAIKAEDGGPILFVQRRLGRGNRFFQMYKFRSMRAERSDADGNRSASRDDDRVTRTGRLIRRTSIDELPQLINVLKGEMSLVGPRPHALGSQAGEKLFWDVDQDYWHRHALKPGLTGLAQIRGYRGATDVEADLTNRLHSDLEYIREWSLKGDAWIVARTIGVLVHPRAF